MTSHRLGRQAWVAGTGAAVPSADAIRPAAGGTVKPTGGLWTSTWDPRRGSAWIRWCIAQDWGARPFDVWLLDPHRAARVFVIDRRRDVERLAEDYDIDWQRVAADYDAVHVTERRLLPAWECESTIWFRWSFSRLVRLGDFP